MMRTLSLVLMLFCAACASIPIESGGTGGQLEYKLGTGDRLRIAVFGEPTLSGEYAIDGTGMIAYPLLGQVAAGSKSTVQLRDEIITRLGSEFIRDPKVTVEVVNYRPVYILGEIARPGEFPFVEGLSALALVAKAGGFTYRANQKVIFIRRESDAAEKAYALDGSLIIHPGDTVRIGERYF